ncbi:hypothetical protein [Ramlibacter sp.]|uniref:hypothetical protein n=1 Tax=Ramlibacter sp. TaxID=1917967 RepID=UPI002D7FF8CF|nr:hypothetical protein [Ramlibacter sp.]
MGRSAFALGLVLALAAAGLAVALAWSLQTDTFGWRQALAFAAVAACGALAVLAWRRSPTGLLRWDGRAWSWEEGGEAGCGHPEIALDLQNRMLLRWQPETGRARWLWPERAADSAHWAALRRAVYSRASAPVPAAGEPPTAEQ